MLDLDQHVDEEAATDRVEVFSLDGETYTAPASPGSAFALQYLAFKREHGEDAAVDWLLRKMLGEGGYAALVGFDRLQDTQLLTVFQVCLDLALGAIEGPKDD